jgi:hypothetical protein
MWRGSVGRGDRWWLRVSLALSAIERKQKRFLKKCKIENQKKIKSPKKQKTVEIVEQTINF